MPSSDKKTKAQAIKSGSQYGRALTHILTTPGPPSHEALEALGKHALAMIRYDRRLKLSEEQNEQLLNAPIPNKGSDYVAVHREEKLRALLQHYKINPSSKNAYYLLSLQLATDFHPGFKTTGPRRLKGPKWSGAAGKLLILLVAKIRSRSKPGRSITSVIRELKRQFPNLYGKYSDQTLKVRYFEALRQHKTVR